MSNIEKWIRAAIEDAPTVRSLSAIYLGAAEYREMREVFREKALLEIPPDCRHAEDKRMEYRGLKIYRVDAEHHLRVA